jgi:hypothetical protein
MLAPNQGPGWPPSEFDDLVVSSSGTKAGAVDTPSLNALYEKLGVAGYVPTAGRASNLAQYQAAYMQVYASAGAAAVTAWLDNVGA